MKKKFLAVLAVMVIALSLSVTAFASGTRLQDDSDLLNGFDKIEINDSLDQLSEELGVDIVIHTTDSLKDMGIWDYADDFYDQGGFAPDGVLLVLKMTGGEGERECYISTVGEGSKAFTDYGINQCLETLHPYLLNGDVAGAFKEFISTARFYFEEERNGKAVDTYDYGTGTKNEPKQISFPTILIRVIIGFGIAFLISLAITAGMKKSMKSVITQRNANVYVKGDNINITQREDRFLYHNVVVVPLPRNDDRNGGGGIPGGSSMHNSSSGVSHGGGGMKF